MEKAFAKVEELAGTIKAYVDNRIRSLKLSAAEKTSGVVANLLAGLLVLVVVLFFIGFASFALSFYLGQLIGKMWAGFLIVAFLHLLIGIVLWSARSRIIRLPVMNALIQHLFNKDDEED